MKPTEPGITPGNWIVETPHYAINRDHYIISTGTRGADYQRLFVVSESVTQTQEVCNAYAAAAIPQLLNALQTCPSPPETSALSPQQLKDWEKAYREWYRTRCSALAKATETPDEVLPQVDAEAMQQAFCKQAGIQSPNEIRHLIQATAMEVCHLLEGIKRQKLTITQQESFTTTIAHHAGIPIKLQFTPVYINGALFLFWESVGAIFWIERLKEWMQLTFPNLHSVRKEDFRTLVTEVKQTTKKPQSPQIPPTQ